MSAVGKKLNYKFMWFRFALVSGLIISGCVSSEVDETTRPAKNEETILNSFETIDDVEMVRVNHGSVQYSNDENDGKAHINMSSSRNHITAFFIKPETPWDVSGKGYVAIALDIENLTDKSSSFYVSTSDHAGGSNIRTMVVPANSSDTYFIELNVPDIALETGIRSNPISWKTAYEPVIWRGGKKQLDLSGISQLRFDVRGVLEDKAFAVDNIRLIYPSEIDSNYLSRLVDQYGQNAKSDFVGKVYSDGDLIAQHANEQAKLSPNPINGRSRFNGWADGPKLKATGYFHTEKYNGKWTLVDPEGYLFYSNGIANVRMANTSTITGYDFDLSKIQSRGVDDLTPEDSIGLNRAPSEAWPTRRVSSELRAKMFTWLPEYAEPLGEYFGYRRELHTGTIERGETYSFYQANLARKYQSLKPESVLKEWRETTIKRMQSWGFTSFGNWVDPEFYKMENFPYFANGWIIGDYKTVSSGNDYWGALPDPFDPVFKERAISTVRQIADEVKDSPWCVGVFIDNEKSWGMMGSAEGQYGIVINTLTLKSKDSPTKAAFSKVLEQKYGSIAALNEAWGTGFGSWDDFHSGAVVKEYSETALSDFSLLLEIYADEYFRIVSDAVDEYMPNHLYFGARFADWAMTPEVRNASARHVDVMSYNYYREGISDVFWEFLKEHDMPSIIGEFHNGALDSGLLNPGLIHAESQKDRGEKYAEYVNSALDNPYFVGTHWFQYIDSPFTGRAYDGENYNVGFVSVADRPYQPLIESAKTVNSNLYQRRFADQNSK